MNNIFNFILIFYKKFLSMIRSYQFTWIRSDSNGLGSSIIANAVYGSWNSIDLIKYFKFY